MWTTAFLLVCIYSLGVCRVCADPDFLEVNLQKEINSSVSLRRQSVSVAWLDRPPYIYDEKGIGIKGILHEIISKGLQLCEGQANFPTKAQNLQQLDQSIVMKKADFAMPVHGSDDGKYGGYEYVEILKSPAVVFIVNREETKEHLRNQVAQAMKDTWPVVVITLLLTCFAGLIIWALDASRNPEEFPHSFTRGVMEGIWWSFVSMTTVGYGDRVPKSLFARFFGILWILAGLVLCSFFIATFTSALTASSIKQRESLLGVEVAVTADSHAFDEAMNHAANVKDYADFYQMYDALVETREVQGILADIYTASYYMEKIDDPRLVISTILSSQRSIGFVIAHNENNEELNKKGECLRKLFKYRQRDIKKIIFKYTRAFHTQTQNRSLTDDDNNDILRLLDGDSRWFRKTFLALLISFVAMLAIGFTYEFCVPRIRAQRCRRPNGCSTNSFILEAKIPTCSSNT